MQSQNKPIISVERVTMRNDDRVVLSDINAEIRRGDFLAITGPNGGGKTTLLRIILKLLHPTEGKVIYHDAKGNPTERLDIGYLPQKNMIDSRFPITVDQVVSSGLIASKNLSREEKRESVTETLRRVDMLERRDSPIGHLSGGQLQRTLLGRALVATPPILVLDEPLSYLDKPFEGKLYDIIEEAAKTTTILLVSHEMSKIASMANRHIIIDHTLTECTAHHHYFTLDCPCPPHPRGATGYTLATRP